MTPQQMIDYLGYQCRITGDELAEAIRRGDPRNISAKHAEVRARMEFLQGYATAMEHAGLMQKSAADAFFAACASAGRNHPLPASENPRPRSPV